MFRAAFWLLLLATIGSAQTEKASPQPPGQLVDVDGHRVHIYCSGNGNPTVIVAGRFSFDWGLVQPAVAQFTRICTYDPAGTAWSDAIPGQTNPSCSDRIDELHRLLDKAGVKGPYVLVGFSIG